MGAPDMKKGDSKNRHNDTSNVKCYFNAMNLFYFVLFYFV
jgi:hypothetical protein